MKTFFSHFIILSLFISSAYSQNVGIGTTIPVSRLHISGTVNSPSIPGNASTGIFRIGINTNEGIDFGKMDSPGNAGWIQSGHNGTLADPLALQPIGGNVGIGTSTPNATLHINGTVKIVDGSQGAGKVLTSDAAGLATWATPSGGGISGSGTLNYIPKWTPNGTTLGNSSMFANSTDSSVTNAGDINIGLQGVNNKFINYSTKGGTSKWHSGVFSFFDAGNTLRNDVFMIGHNYVGDSVDDATKAQWGFQLESNWKESPDTIIEAYLRFYGKDGGHYRPMFFTAKKSNENTLTNMNWQWNGVHTFKPTAEAGAGVGTIQFREDARVAIGASDIYNKGRLSVTDKDSINAALELLSTTVNDRPSTGNFGKIDWVYRQGANAATFAQQSAVLIDGTVGLETGDLIMKTINAGVLAEHVRFKGNGNVLIKDGNLLVNTTTDIGFPINANGFINTNAGFAIDGSSRLISGGFYSNATGFNIYKKDGSAVLFYVENATGDVGIGTTSPNSKLDVSGSFATAITTTTSNLTLDATHHTVIITGGTPTITFPAAGSTNARRIYSIINQTVTDVTCSSYIQRNGSASTNVLSTNSIEIQSDGTNWYQIR